VALVLRQGSAGVSPDCGKDCWKLSSMVVKRPGTGSAL
jgi:hypothetical protein